MNILSIVILATAFVSLAIGLILYYNSRKGGDRTNFYSTNLICWLLIALFPALIIFSFFPQNNSMTGSILGFSVSGAVALFVYIWWQGTKMSLDAAKADDLNNQIRSLQQNLEKCQASLSKDPSKPTVFSETQTFPYRLKKFQRKQIVLITGNLQGVKCADIWVNSENTNMQMSRYFERSISGTIRYEGAKKDIAGDVIEDVIFNELSALMSTKTVVQAATVLITGSGELAQSHGVKRIFHVAAVRGQVGSGYQPVDNIEDCVRKVLEKTEAPDLACASILFPLLGTGTGRGRLAEVASVLVTAAIGFLESKENTSIQSVYFLNWTDFDLEACRGVLDKCDRVEAIK